MVQKPEPTGTVVKSVNQTWLGYFEVTTRCFRSGDWAAVGWVAGFSLRMRPTVVTPKCKPARARIWAIFALPSMGQSVFSRWTRYRTKSGNLLTGSGLTARHSDTIG